MKKLLFLLFITSFCIAQNANRKFISQSYKNNVLEIKTSEGYYLMKPFSEKIIETSFIPNGEKNNITSHAVIKSVENIKCKVVNNSKTLSLETSGIKVI